MLCKWRPVKLREVIEDKAPLMSGMRGLWKQTLVILRTSCSKPSDPTVSEVRLLFPSAECGLGGEGILVVTTGTAPDVDIIGQDFVFRTIGV